MGRKRKIRLRDIVFLYLLCLTGIFILAAVSFTAGVHLPVPEDTQDLYIDLEGVELTGNGITIPLEELDRHIVTKQEINSALLPYYNKWVTGVALTSFSVALLLAFAFACFLTHGLTKPIEKVAESLRHFDRKEGLEKVKLPQELVDIEAAFTRAQEEIICLRGDLENMSSYISHDQKNSLAVLRAMIQNECPNIQNRVGAQLDRMVKSLDDILTLSSNGSKPEKVDLPLVCGTAVDEYRKVCPHISFDFDEEADLTIMGHELLLYRAVSNLIDNAVKYGQGKPVEVTMGARNGCPFVSVRDYGIGISITQQEKIFESRYRIGNRKKDGYGIGLSLVRHVMSLHNGFVWVESRENSGATFKLVFPAFTLD